MTSSHSHGTKHGHGGVKASYSKDIKPLFTNTDRTHMSFAFDLFVYDDVKTNANEIHERLHDKTMPPAPEGPWSDEKIALFKRWIDDGCQP